MKIIFMGTPDFSVEAFLALIEAGHEITLAVTQPDKPKGRGEKMQFSPIKEVALQHNIPVFQPRKIRDAESIEELRKYQADIMVVIAFGQILPKEILEMTPYGCMNVHASLLPKYRGAAPIQWAVINGEKVSGVTTMQMDEGLDTGDMIMKTEVELSKDETGGSLFDKLSKAGAKLCVETLTALEEKTARFEKQGESETDYARMLNKSMGNIDWSKDAASIECLIRGLNPWPSAYSNLDGKVMKIWEAQVLDMDEEVEAGTVVKVEKEGFAVQTGRGQLKVKTLQMPGKKRMDAGSFLRGYHMETGTRFNEKN